MAVIKNISIQIFKFKPNTDGTQSSVMFQSVATDTLDFPPQHVAALILAVTGHACDDEDHCLLNDLHCQGKCAFKFGGDWEFYITASVTYPEE